MPAHVFRVDDRLIHGQVVVGWVKRLNLNGIVVANNRVTGDLIQRNLMELAIPREIRSFFFRVEETLANLDKPAFAQMKYILLVDSLRDAMTLIDGGLQTSEINIGGLHFRENKKQYTSSLFLDQEDVRIIEELIRRNVFINAQPLPDDTRADILKIIQKETP